MYYLKKSSKGKSGLVAKLDKVFSQFIRLRDCMEGGMTMCISCGKVKPFSSMDCGHYHSRRHMGTRWSEDNAHAECNACNRFSSEHLIGYRERLLRKIGETRFNMLAVQAREVRKWSDFELEQLIIHYKKEVARLSKEKGVKVK